MKVHVFVQADGALSILVPCWRDRRTEWLIEGRWVSEAEFITYVQPMVQAGKSVEHFQHRPELEERWIARVIAHKLQADPHLRDRTQATVDADQLPASGRFRMCWRFRGGRVAVDLGLARGQVLEEVRQERDARLRASDGPMMRAMDLAQGIQEWRDYRQALRDLLANTPETLGAIPDVDGLVAWEPAWPALPTG